MGRILFNPPEEMKVGDRELVEVRITQNITGNLTKWLKGRGVPQINKKKEYEVGDWEINVRVNPYWTLKCHWKFIVATFLTIVGLIIAVITIRKKKK